MKLGEKILINRKKLGMSQEELANELGVSRQSISKWELGTSAPEIDKLLRLSEIFEISLDDLVKEPISDDIKVEAKSNETSSEDESKKEVSTGPRIVIPEKELNEETAGEYFTGLKKVGIYSSLSKFLFIVSPTFLILLGGMASYNVGNIKENTAGFLGILMILILFSIALVLSNLCRGEQSYLDEYKSVKIIYKLKSINILDNLTNKLYTRSRLFKNIGISLTCLCVAPIFLFGLASNNEVNYIYGVVLLLIICGLGVSFLNLSKITDTYLDIILEKGDYSRESKENEFVKRETSGKGLSGKINKNGYWILVITIYLAVSFITKRWDVTWLIILAGEGLRRFFK